MLNRRILRIKAMQALFGWQQAGISSVDFAKDSIKDTFTPDLNSPDVQDVKSLEKEKKQALNLFEQSLKLKESSVTSDAPDNIINAANKALEIFKNQKDKDQKHFLKLMKDDINEIYRWYIYFTNFPVELLFFLKNENEARKTKLIKDPRAAIPYHYLQNKTALMLEKSKELEKMRGKYKASWAPDLLKKLFREYLNTDEVFLKYNSKTTTTIEEDQQILLHIYKDILFKDKNLNERFEEDDINWLENKSIIKSMVVKTIKSAEGTDTEFKLLEISNNWEEDELFFLELFQKTASNDAFLEEVVGERTKNWNVERLAILDKVLLKMAISEMMHFSSIPVKVTINEYIEISKLYSTPKSRQFINGMLDKVASDFAENGLIRKSGRGLIDNK